LELPEELAVRARALATQAHRRLEDLVVEWIGRAVASPPPVDSLPDEELLAVCNLQLENGDQEALSDLLARNADGLLPASEQGRLDALMEVYRHGLVRKAQALKSAVARGLIPPLR